MAQRSVPSPDTTATRTERADEVLSWSAAHGRDLPWRHTRDPWAVLVSEVMAQQTQVERVIPKWMAFLQRWPSPHECAAASLGDVLRFWEGLGYPRRAKHLHQAAKLIAGQGRFPGTFSSLLALPGVGQYTARAVLAFAFEQDVAVVDTNTARVLARWENRTMNRSDVQAAADAALPEGGGWAWNQAMLDLGALICTRTNPKCGACPVSNMCAYRYLASSSAVPVPDPADGTSGVSTRQSAFVGSDRQYRGRILRAAADEPAVCDVAVIVGLANDSGRATRLVESLIADGLAAMSGGCLVLPGE